MTKWEPEAGTTSSTSSHSLSSSIVQVEPEATILLQYKYNTKDRTNVNAITRFKKNANTNTRIIIKPERYKYKHQDSIKAKGTNKSTTILLVVLLPEVVHLLRFHKMIEIVAETLFVLTSAALFPDTQKPTLILCVS